MLTETVLAADNSLDTSYDWLVPVGPRSQPDREEEMTSARPLAVPQAEFGGGSELFFNPFPTN